MKGTIEIQGMEFHSYHGCLPEERRKGARYLVDFSCTLDMDKASRSDALEDTLDYSAVYRIVATQMAEPSNLLEHVAGRIARAVKKEFPSIGGIRVKVSKQHPPVGGETAWASVSVEL